VLADVALSPRMLHARASPASVVIDCIMDGTTCVLDCEECR
jgi:hypothetical protein